MEVQVQVAWKVLPSQVPLGGSGILELLRSSTNRKNILFGGPLSLGLRNSKLERSPKHVSQSVVSLAK